MDNNKCATPAAKDGTACSTKGPCPVKGCIVKFIAIFVIIFGFNWGFHHILMMPLYEKTASVWRSPDQMMNFWWIMPVCQALMAAAIACIFGWVIKGKSECACPVGLGLKFGLKIGVLLGALQLSSYVYLPIPKEIALSWFGGDVVMGLIIGLVLGLMAKKCAKDQNCAKDKA